MNIFEKIFDQLNISFIWKGNKKKVMKQAGNGLQVLQEQQGVTNIFQIENVTVTNIQELAGIDVSSDPTLLLKSAGRRFLAEQKTKQENLKKAVEEAGLGEIENPEQVEQDWFLKWMEVSQGVSRENVRVILAKVLKGEVKKSGTFSLRSLEILKNISREELIVFQRFCDVSYFVPTLGDGLTCVITAPFGNPGTNTMTSLGLSYSALTMLQDAGLIQSELNAWREYPSILWQVPFTIGSKNFALKPTEEKQDMKTRVSIINFTNTGLELRSVLTLGSNKEYEDKFLEWVKNTFKMVLVS